jgi:threonine dehydrogenase-like Zn-dependent dehydrogenase
MSGYQTFAVWGAGDVGKHVIAELLLRGVSTTVLTRPVSKRIYYVSLLTYTIAFRHP